MHNNQTRHNGNLAATEGEAFEKSPMGGARCFRFPLKRPSIRSLVDALYRNLSVFTLGVSREVANSVRFKSQLRAQGVIATFPRLGLNNGEIERLSPVSDDVSHIIQLCPLNHDPLSSSAPSDVR